MMYGNLNKGSESHYALNILKEYKCQYSSLPLFYYLYFIYTSN